MPIAGNPGFRSTKLRTRLTKELGRPIPDKVWRVLAKEEATKIALEEGDDVGDESSDSWEQLFSACASMLALHDATARTVPLAPPQPTYEWIHLDPHEQHRAQVVRATLAKRALQLPVVARFINRTIGSPLPPEVAREWVASPVGAIFPVEWFVEHGVDFVAYRAEVVSVEMSDRGLRATVTVTPPGRTFAAEVPCGPADLPELLYPAKDGARLRVKVWPGSLLDELRILAESLAERFVWVPEQVTRFLLTAEAPDREPIRAWSERAGSSDGYIRGMIRLEVEPWVSSASVEKTYRAIQQFMIGYHRNRRGETVPKDNRPVPPRSLTVFEFVEDRRFREGDQEQWRHLAREWNAACPEELAEWRYEGGTATRGSPGALDKFKRSYEDAEARLVRTAYFLPGPDPRSISPARIEWKRNRPSDSKTDSRADGC